MSIHPLSPMLRKLQSRSPLDASDCDAILALPYTIRSVDYGSYLVREGETPRLCSMIVKGLAYRHKVTGEGGRQILSLHIPGDFLDLQHLFLNEADHNVQTLTRAEIAFVPARTIEELTLRRPAIGRAMWVDALVDASIFREWIVNVGRRDSRARIAHLLCEFALRLESAGLAEEYSYDLPMTQEQLADAVGLTPVHVNRVLKSLTADGLIARDKRALSIGDWDAMTKTGDFNSRYLHLEQALPGGVGNFFP